VVQVEFGHARRTSPWREIRGPVGPAAERAPPARKVGGADTPEAMRMVAIT